MVKKRGCTKRRILKTVKLSAAVMQRLKTQHENEAHDAIKEIDRKDARSQARAPFIVVTNATEVDGK